MCDVAVDYGYIMMPIFLRASIKNLVRLETMSHWVLPMLLKASNYQINTMMTTIGCLKAYIIKYYADAHLDCVAVFLLQQKKYILSEEKYKEICDELDIS